MFGDTTNAAPHRASDLRVRAAFLGLLGTAIVVILGFAYIIPVSVSSEATTPGNNCSGCTAPGFGPGSVGLPGGQNVTLDWRDVSGGQVSVRVYGPGQDGPTVAPCTATGSSGSCSFRSAGGSYWLRASDAQLQGGQLVTFTATYYTSLF